MRLTIHRCMESEEWIYEVFCGRILICEVQEWIGVGPYYSVRMKYAGKTMEYEHKKFRDKDPEWFNPRKLTDLKDYGIDVWTYTYGGVGKEGRVYTYIQSRSFYIGCANTAEGTVFFSNKLIIGKINHADSSHLPIIDTYCEPFLEAWFSDDVSSDAVYAMIGWILMGWKAQE